MVILIELIFSLSITIFCVCIMGFFFALIFCGKDVTIDTFFRDKYIFRGVLLTGLISLLALISGFEFRA